MIDQATAAILTPDIDFLGSDSSECEALAESLLARWRNGDSIDAIGALQKYSLIRRNQSLAVDLAYEEFCLRHSRGERIDVVAFCDKFPEIRRSLERQIEFHKLMEENPDVLKGFSEPNWPDIGSTFLGFKLRSEIGRGAFARVYLASEIALGDRDVVVKVSTVGGAEANTLGRLGHPGIVPIHSVFDDASTHLTAMCMPSLGQLTLHDLFSSPGGLTKSKKHAMLAAFKKRRRNSADCEQLDDQYTGTVLQFAIKLADALSFAHEAGVLHLDLKPSNILITEAGEPMLLDFNLCHDATQDATRVGGTLPYMSPEQLVAFARNAYDLPQVSVLSDVYGFGVILFHILQGCLPFAEPFEPSSALSESACRHISLRQGGMPEWSNRDLSISHSIRKLVSDCLEFDTSRRPQSMKDVLLRLQSELRWSKRVRNWGFRQRRVVFATGVLCLTLPFINNERPAYRTRLVSRAISNYENRYFDRVIDQTSTLLSSNNADHEASILQCLAFTQKRDYVRAMQAFKESRGVIKDARIMAVAGHCFAVSKHHDDAIGWYSDAIRAGLDNNANVHNNLGFSLMQRNRLEEAISHFDKALALDPSHPATLHNYALAEFKVAHKSEEFSPKPIALIQQAIKNAEPSWELERSAAWIYAWAEHQHNLSSDGAVVRHLQRSLQLGIDRRVLADDPSFKPYLSKVMHNAKHLKEVVKEVRPSTHVHEHQDLLLQIRVGITRSSNAI